MLKCTSSNCTRAKNCTILECNTHKILTKWTLLVKCTWEWYGLMCAECALEFPWFAGRFLSLPWRPMHLASEIFNVIASMRKLAIFLSADNILTFIFQLIMPQTKGRDFIDVCISWSYPVSLDGVCWACLEALKSWAVWNGSWLCVFWPAGCSVTSVPGRVLNPLERSVNISYFTKENKENMIK